MGIFTNLVPLFTPFKINCFLAWVNTVITNPSMYAYITLIITAICLGMLAIYILIKFVKWESKKILESLELWLSVWAVLTSGLFFIGFWFFVLVSKDLGSTVFHFRAHLKNLSYGSLLIAIFLTLPLVCKESLQSYMKKAFLGGDPLEKPYKRLFILLCIGLGVMSESLIQFYFKCSSMVSNIAALSCMQFTIWSLYFIIKKNFFFFFGDVEEISSIKLLEISPIAIAPQVLYRHQGRYNKRRNYFLARKLLYKLKVTGLIRVFYRNTGPDFSSHNKEMQEAQDLIQKAFLEHKIGAFYTGHQREIADGLRSKMLHPDTLVGNGRFWNERTMVNLNHRIDQVGQDIVFWDSLKSRNNGVLASVRNRLIDYNLKDLKIQEKTLTEVPDLQTHNLQKFLTQNPEIPRTRAMNEFAMCSTKEILIENRHFLKFSRQYQAMAVFSFTGYFTYKAMLGPPSEDIKKKE